MTEQGPELGSDQSDADVPEWAERRPTSTGVAAVDAVLADVEHVDNLSPAEQLAVFERVHESLRAALDATPSDEPPDVPGGPGGPVESA